LVHRRPEMDLCEGGGEKGSKENTQSPSFPFFLAVAERGKKKGEKRI